VSPRKKLDEIKQYFDEPEQGTATPTQGEESEVTGSLTDTLKQPKKKPGKIRFTLDLEKPLDERLNQAAKRLNRSKAEITRFALERLLEELEEEWG
jgi:hypothetical protein